MKIIYVRLQNQFFLQMFVGLLGHERWNNRDIKNLGERVKRQLLYRVFIFIINKYSYKIIAFCDYSMAKIIIYV